MSLHNDRKTARTGRSVRLGGGIVQQRPKPKPTKPAPAKSRPRVNLQLDKAVSVLHALHTEVHDLITLLEQAKEETALNKFIHFDFPRTVKRLLEHKGILFRLLDENESFHVPFSSLFRHFNLIQSTLERVQAGVGRLQFAAVRKDSWSQLKLAADRVSADLEHIRDSGKELERLMLRR